MIKKLNNCNSKLNICDVSPAAVTAKRLGDILFSGKTMVGLFVFTILFALFPEIVLATDLANNPFVDGITNMAEDAGPVLAILGVAVGGARAGYCAFRRAGCDPEDSQKWDKGMKTAIICGIACSGFGVIMTVIGGYFTF